MCLGVNFTNILQADFTRADPKGAKKTVKLSSFFALSGSAGVKAAGKNIGEIYPRSVPMVCPAYRAL